MTVKSIIDIEVNDGEFKAFAALYDRYRKSTEESKRKAQGKGGVEAEAAHSAKRFASNAAAMFKNVDKGNKQWLAQQSQLNRGLAQAGRVMGAIGKGAGVVASNIGRATASILRFARAGAILGGLAGLGSAFGIGRLAASVSNERRQAQGLNTTTGDQKAFNINYGRYVDPDSLVSNVAEARQDYSKRWAFSALGLSEAQMKGKSNTEVATMLLPLIRQKFEQGGKSVQGMQAFGLDNFVSLQDANRLSNASPEDLARARSGFETDRKRLAVGDDTQKRWQDFWSQLSRAGDQIENTFVKGLTPLIGPFTKLSTSIANALDTVLGNPDLPGYIDAMGKGIERFAKYINSDDAKNDMRDFLDSVKKIGHALGVVADFIAPKPITPENEKPNSTVNTTVDKLDQFFADMGFNPYSDKTSPQSQMYELEKKNNLPYGLLDRVWSTESSRGKNLLSDKGAKGPFGFMPATAKEYGLTDPNDFSTSAEAAARKYKDLIKMYGGDMDKASAAYNWGNGKLDKDIADHGDDWKKYLPAETKDYIDKVSGNLPKNTAEPTTMLSDVLGRLPSRTGESMVRRDPQPRVEIKIQNNTGGNATVVTNQLAY